ncbi:acyl-CoA thioesterase [Dactylosporangium sp. CA-092794]|uniref:acyl-CoA thioesterase n=1 Tax=Dactylosporangium sp. CA-092794 TaxID=3239929 RepID=UPI003D944613
MSDERRGVEHKVRVQWIDTDAAGHYHHSSVLRWVEAAEALLYRELDIDGIFGAVPRVRYEVDYLSPLWFDDVATVRLWIDRVGSSSLEFEFEVVANAGVIAARGRQTVVHVPKAGEGSARWPAGWSAKLTAASRG